LVAFVLGKIPVKKLKDHTPVHCNQMYSKLVYYQETLPESTGSISPESRKRKSL
jgi:hypothetical protein